MIDEKDEYRLSQQSHLDAEWKCLQGYLPPLPKRGRPPIHVARGPFSMRSSTCCAPAAHGAISPPTFHRGRPSSTISGVCASKGPGRSCYGRCTGLNANDKEGILTQVPPAWILKA